MSLQMAYYKMKGAIPATYESCSTAAFKHGRTETIRSATNETKSACQAFEDKNIGPEKLYELMKNCTAVHNQLTKEAALGERFIINDNVSFRRPPDSISITLSNIVQTLAKWDVLLSASFFIISSFHV